MVRNPGKFGKQKRGGGRQFSKNLQLDENGTAVASTRPRDWDGEDSDEDDEDGSEEEEESEEETPAAAGEAGAASSSRPKQKKVTDAQPAAEGDDDPDLVNPNRQGMKTLSLAEVGAPRQQSRREKEQQDKKEAKERYWKLHQAGKTDEAKSDLARLAKIRKDREEAQAKRKAEAEAKATELEAKKKAQRS